MSRNINVNPGHYKVAGRERQGEDIIHEQQKQTYAAQQTLGMNDGVPPWEATRHSFVSAQPPEQAPPKKARKSKPKRRASRTTRTAARKVGRKSVRATTPETANPYARPAPYLVTARIAPAQRKAQYTKALDLPARVPSGQSQCAGRAR